MMTDRPHFHINVLGTSRKTTTRVVPDGVIERHIHVDALVFDDSAKGPMVVFGVSRISGVGDHWRLCRSMLHRPLSQTRVLRLVGDKWGILGPSMKT